MKSNLILGSGLVALICRKILGPNWKIIPLGPSRFYSKGVPALGDDFINYDLKVLDIVKEWGINKTNPFFFKRPLSISGELMYSNAFIDNYLSKIGFDSNPQIVDYHKCDFTVFEFGCIQLWKYLLSEFIDEIKAFYSENNIKNIKRIKDNTIMFDNNKTIEYDKMISTIPYNALCNMIGHKDDNSDCFLDSYYYYIEDNKLNLDNANQVLVCDYEIPFYKCTKIRHNKYLFEFLTYNEDIYNLMTPILGANFDILNATMIRNGFVKKGIINNELMNKNNITCVGSYAQCDPMIDIGSVIKRMHNLMSRKMIQ